MVWVREMGRNRKVGLGGGGVGQRDGVGPGR